MKVVLSGGFAVAMAAIIGAWVSYQARSAKPKPWNTKAILATFDHLNTESGEPEGANGSRPNTIVLYYTLENTTELDYHTPSQDQLEVSARLKDQKSLAGSSGLVRLEEQVFVPPKQRRQFAVHFHYPVKQSLGPEPNTAEERRKKRRLVAEYMKKELSNLDGFVVFDSTNRYQINLPSGWDNVDLNQ